MTADVPPMKSKANAASSNFIFLSNLKFIINILSQLTGFITYGIIYLWIQLYLNILIMNDMKNLKYDLFSYVKWFNHKFYWFFVYIWYFKVWNVVFVKIRNRKCF
jgi:hypothetical protein